MSKPKAPKAESKTAARRVPPPPPAGERAGAVPLRPLLAELCAVALRYAFTFVSMSLIFQPTTWWPLAFVCLTPWAVATCRTDRAWVAHWLSFLGGWIFFLANLRWLMPVTGLGFVALAFYLAIYWPLAAWALRTGRRRGISPIWTLPVIWVACEYLRAFVMSGIPWLFLSHSFAGVLSLIQISDITGAYGVTFLAAMVNGVFTEASLQKWTMPGDVPRRKQLRIGAICCGVAIVAALVYGQYRLGQVGRVRQGPKVAVIQEDFPLVSTPPYGDPPWIIFTRYIDLAAQAVLTTEPDLVVFPETVWSTTQNKSFVENDYQGGEDDPRGVWLFSRQCHDAISAFARGEYAAVNEALNRMETFAQRANSNTRLPRLPEVPARPVTVIVGAKSVEYFPEHAYPKRKEYNSALVYAPDGQQLDERYDKQHLVPFGEAVPFRYGRLHWLYRRLNALSPFSGKDGTHEYSLSTGARQTRFALGTAPDRPHFGTPICYEDVMPRIARKYVWDGSDRRVDFLVNISNDGWFLHSSELPQHLAICVFRAVENRVGIVRAVNTGISGFIDPDGRVYSLVRAPDGRLYRKDAEGRGVVGYSTDHVLIDNRHSFYGRFGDWLPKVCLILAAVLWIEGIVARWVWGLRQHLLMHIRKRGARNA